MYSEEGEKRRTNVLGDRGARKKMGQLWQILRRSWGGFRGETVTPAGPRAVRKSIPEKKWGRVVRKTIETENYVPGQRKGWREKGGAVVELKAGWDPGGGGQTKQYYNKRELREKKRSFKGTQ